MIIIIKIGKKNVKAGYIPIAITNDTVKLG